MSEVPKSFSGRMRVLITPMNNRKVKVDWIDDSTGDVIWSETCETGPGFSFISSVIPTGDFEIGPGFFVDRNGKRHHVIHCEPGILSSALGGR